MAFIYKFTWRNRQYQCKDNRTRKKINEIENQVAIVEDQKKKLETDFEESCNFLNYITR